MMQELSPIKKSFKELKFIHIYSGAVITRSQMQELPFDETITIKAFDPNTAKLPLDQVQIVDTKTYKYCVGDIPLSDDWIPLVESDLLSLTAPELFELRESVRFNRELWCKVAQILDIKAEEEKYQTSRYTKCLQF